MILNLSSGLHGTVATIIMLYELGKHRAYSRKLAQQEAKRVRWDPTRATKLTAI